MARLPAWQIDAERERAETRQDALLAVFRVAYGRRWDSVKKVEGFPYINHETSLAIGRRLMDFDRAHPDTNMVGGYWLNYGFSTQGPNLPDWTVLLPDTELA